MTKHSKRAEPSHAKPRGVRAPSGPGGGCPAPEPLPPTQPASTGASGVVEAEAPTPLRPVEYVDSHIVGFAQPFAETYSNANVDLKPVGDPPKPRPSDHAARYVALLLDTLATLEATTPEAWDAFEQLCDRIERHLETS